MGKLTEPEPTWHPTVIPGGESEYYRAVGPPRKSLTEAMEDAEAICLAHKALEIMMERGWQPIRIRDGFWQVEDENGKCLTVGDGRNWWDDPFTALVAVDKWYRGNAEKALAEKEGRR